MSERLLIVLLLSGSLFATAAWSQSNDIGAERSRVANERIRVEAERIAQEEKRRAEAAAEAERLRSLEAEKTEVERQDLAQPESDVTPATIATSATASRSDGETSRLGMSLMLEHLNALGQLRDSGYVTEAEFERIKQRILDGEL